MSADAYADRNAQTETTEPRPRAGAPATGPSDPWRVEEAPTVADSQVTFDYRNGSTCPNCCDGDNQRI